MFKYIPESYNKVAKKKYGYKELNEAYKNGDIVEMEVLKCMTDGVLCLCTTDDITAIVPMEEYEYTPWQRAVEEKFMVQRIGSSVRVKIKSKQNIDGKEQFTCSRKMAMQECYENYISKMVVGQVIPTRISSITNCGIFCDIGCGFPAIMKLKDFSINRVGQNDLKRVKKINAVVKSVDDSGRVTLSHKELLGTWDEEVAKFNQGDTVRGIVRANTNTGAFIELTPNLTGMAFNANGFELGSRVSVKIVKINFEAKTLSLDVVGRQEVDGTVSPSFEYRIPESKIVVDWKYK